MDLQDGAASNAFAVGGKYTNTGKPLLANDPHLTLQAPNILMHCHLTVENTEDQKDEMNDNADSSHSTTDMHVTGVIVPGMPAFVIGHTEYIGWGITLGFVSVYIEITSLNSGTGSFW